MSCFSDEKIILCYSGLLTDEQEKKAVEAHILSCDECFDKYFYLFKISWKEEVLLGNIDSYSLPPLPKILDFIIQSEAQLEEDYFSILSQDIIIEAFPITTRAQDYKGFKISKKEYPDFFLFKENIDHWFVFFEEDIEALLLMVDDKTYYKSAYRKKDLILLPQPNQTYTFSIGKKRPFSFKLY